MLFSILSFFTCIYTNSFLLLHFSITMEPDKDQQAYIRTICGFLHTQQVVFSSA